MRVTVDLDSPSELKLLATYFNMKGLNGNINVRRSAGGEGYHLIVRGLPITFETSLLLRRLFGDDQVRISFDEEDSEKPKQVLYRKKGKKVITPLDERNILALPFFSKLRPEKWFK